MRQHELRPAAGSTRPRKRVGRGNASGHGTYSTRGLKGQKARSGGGVRPGFEGGQLPLIRRMARKRGFRNPFRIEYEEVNVGALTRFPAGTVVTAKALAVARLIRGAHKPVKVLGEGELSVALTVEADRFSAAAQQKIEAAGGSVSRVGAQPVERPADGKRAKRVAGAIAAQAARVETAATAKAERAAVKAAGGKPKKAKAGEGAQDKPKKVRAPKAERPPETEQPEAVTEDAAPAPREEADDGAGG